MKKDILEEVASGTLKPKKAYKLLFKKKYKQKRIHFIKLNINLHEQKGLTTLLKVLFLLPVPISLAALFIKKRIKASLKINKEEFKDLIATLKRNPINVYVKNKEVKLVLRTL